MGRPKKCRLYGSSRQSFFALLDARGELLKQCRAARFLFGCEAFLKECENGGFFRFKRLYPAGELLFGSLLKRLQHRSIQIGIEDHRVDITLSANGRRIPESLSYGLYRLQQ